MKQKTIESILYSTAGLLVVLAIVLAVNVIASAAKVRLDMTADKLFTLSDGTKKILRDLDAPVEARFYFSRSERNLPGWAATLAENVEDLLAEFAQNAGGKLVVRKFDPKPDTEIEDQALSDGIERQMAQGGNTFFLGMAISMDPRKATLPAIVPVRERLLEYDVARAIAGVMATTKPTIGVMSPLPMFGTQFNPMMMQMGRRPDPPWIAITELQRDFNVRELPMTSTSIPPEIKVLIVAQPREITESAQYAIDQFIMRGGKLIALLDAMSLLDRPAASNPMMQMMPGGGSNLDRLLPAWGIKFDHTQVVADLTFARELQFSESREPQLMPTWLFLNDKGINRDDVVASEIDNLLLPVAGHFTGSPVAGLTQTVLLRTTTQSQLVDGMTAQFDPQKVANELKPGGVQLALAVRLQGRFKSAFPDGPPAADPGENDQEKPKPDAAHLKESAEDNVVVLIGDSDFIYDNFAVRRIPLFNIAQPMNGNLNLFQNIVEQLAGDSRLIGVRSRATIQRPFTVVRDKELAAQSRYRNEIARLQEELQETERKIRELEGQKEPGQQLILSPEQQQQIAEFRKKEAQARKNLRQVQLDLRREIDSLQNRIKWANIAGMPLLVSLAGLIMAFLHHQRTKAK